MQDNQTEKCFKICLENDCSIEDKHRYLEELAVYLKNALKDTEDTLIECQERNRFFSQSIARLQQECEAKDALVIELQNEIDKFRQIVKPLTQVFWQQHQSQLTYKHRRIKRQGCSAEPLINLQEAEVRLLRTLKSSKSRDLIKSAILDNDFMKNLDIAQIQEIVDCMYPVKYAAKSLIIKEGDVGSIVYVMEALLAFISLAKLTMVAGCLNKIPWVRDFLCGRSL
uniref:Cyclic nucleotide-binding domain-containing protein n=1 Tax=Glossina palpalis gambiensis TaxID=67801 RepID=A0A1B0BC86_9MUSC